MKLNIACGNRTKENFFNIDMNERDKELDMVVDLTQKFPFKTESCEYIYAEQFIEHLNWLEGKRFLRHCFRTLKSGGTLRLVLPHYKKIFQKYIENDYEFFEVFFRALNEGDYPYYCDVYNDPEKVMKDKKTFIPPWHTSGRLRDRKRLELRVRRFNYLIDVVHYFTHQFGEHQCLYDYISLRNILHEIGFEKVIETDIIKGFDSETPTRVTSSLYIEAIKKRL